VNGGAKRRHSLSGFKHEKAKATAIAVALAKNKNK